MFKNKNSSILHLSWAEIRTTKHWSEQAWFSPHLCFTEEETLRKSGSDLGRPCSSWVQPPDPKGLLLTSGFSSHFVGKDIISVDMPWLGIPWQLGGKESACQAGGLGSISASGRPPGEGNVNPLQYSFLENPIDRGAWWAAHSPWECRVRRNNRLPWLPPL